MNYNPFPFKENMSIFDKIVISIGCLLLVGIVSTMIYAEEWEVLIWASSIAVFFSTLLYFLVSSQKSDELKVGDNISYSNAPHHPNMKGKIVKMTKCGAVIEFEPTEVPLVCLSLPKEKK